MYLAHGTALEVMSCAQWIVLLLQYSIESVVESHRSSLAATTPADPSIYRAEPDNARPGRPADDWLSSRRVN